MGNRASSSRPATTAQAQKNQKNQKNQKKRLTTTGTPPSAPAASYFSARQRAVPSLPGATFYGSWAARPSHIPADVNAASLAAAAADAATADALCRRDKQEGEVEEEAGDATCTHPRVTVWQWDICADCGAHLSAARLAEEQAHAARAAAEDAAAAQTRLHADTLRSCGVRLDWLLAFTFDHDCWAWTTERVVHDIIVPATRARRCRFAHLPTVTPFTGPARVFMSHCWGARWGDLVLASIQGAREDRIVWIDVFAVRQWPGNDADLDFRGVIQGCAAVVITVSTDSTTTAKLRTVFDDPDIEIPRFLESADGARAKRCIAFFRLWCVVEIAAAVEMGVPVLVKSGTALSLAANDVAAVPSRRRSSGSLRTLSGSATVLSTKSDGSHQRMSDGLMRAVSAPNAAATASASSAVFASLARQPAAMSAVDLSRTEIKWLMSSILERQPLQTDGHLDYRTVKAELLRVCSRTSFAAYEQLLKQSLREHAARRFVYDTRGAYRVLANLAYMVDTIGAESAVPADRERELRRIEDDIEGGVSRVDAPACARAYLRSTLPCVESLRRCSV